MYARLYIDSCFASATLFTILLMMDVNVLIMMNVFMQIPKESLLLR
jgi:hypothetical protein